MNEETKKIIDEQMKILPADVKMAISSLDYRKKLEEIVKRQRLMIDQAGKVEMETTLVMIGLEPLSDYIENLARELDVNEDRAKQIAMDVNENIFKSIRKSLENMEGEIETDTKEELGVFSSETKDQEEYKALFTNTNEETLNRDQILNEIENPIPNRTIEEKEVVVEEKAEEETNKIAIRPIQEVEIRPKAELNTVPGEEVVDNTKTILEQKMSETVVSNNQNIEVKPEIKLPEISKKESRVDPYKEPLI